MPNEKEEQEKIKNEISEKDLKCQEYVENLKNYFAIFKKENNLIQMEKLLKEIETNYSQYVENYHLKILKEDVECAKQREKSKENFDQSVKKFKKEINVAIGKANNTDEINKLVDQMEALLNSEDAKVVNEKAIADCKKVLVDFRNLVKEQPKDMEAYKAQLKEKYNKDKDGTDEVLLRSVLNEIDHLTHNAELCVIRDQLRSPKTSEYLDQLKKGLDRMRQWSWSGHLLTEEDEDLYVEVKGAVEKLEQPKELSENADLKTEEKDPNETEKSKNSVDSEDNKSFSGKADDNSKTKSSSDKAVSEKPKNKSIKSDKVQEHHESNSSKSDLSEDNVHSTTGKLSQGKDNGCTSSTTSTAQSSSSKKSKKSMSSKEQKISKAKLSLSKSTNSSIILSDKSNSNENSVKSKSSVSSENNHKVEKVDVKKTNASVSSSENKSVSDSKSTKSVKSCKSNSTKVSSSSESSKSSHNSKKKTIERQNSIESEMDVWRSDLQLEVNEANLEKLKIALKRSQSLRDKLDEFGVVFTKRDETLLRACRESVSDLEKKQEVDETKQKEDDAKKNELKRMLTALKTREANLSYKPKNLESIKSVFAELEELKEVFNQYEGLFTHEDECFFNETNKKLNQLESETESSKSAENSLRCAIAKRDHAELCDAIEKAESAKFFVSDDDLEAARKLADFIDPHTRMHEIKFAAKSRDTNRLRTAIDNFVAANVKNQENFLDKAERTLYRLEKLERREARERRRKSRLEAHKKRVIEIVDGDLETAVLAKDVEKLEVAVEAVQVNEVNETELVHFQDAEKLLKVLKIEYLFELFAIAMSERNFLKLEDFLRHADTDEYRTKLEKEIEVSHAQVVHLKALEKCRSNLVQTNRLLLSEISSYPKPPQLVKTVMTATFVILGESLTQANDWTAIQHWLSKQGRYSVTNRVRFHQPENVSARSRKYARSLIDDVRTNDVKRVSLCAGTFVEWAKRVLVEAEQIEKLREIDEKIQDDELIHEVSENQGDEKNSQVKEKKKAKLDLSQLKVQHAVGINTRNVEKLQDFVEKATSNEELYENLKAEVVKSEEQIEHLKKYHKAKNSISKADMTEINSFSNPPQFLKNLMRATLLLLGHSPAQVKDWNYIRKTFGAVNGEKSILLKFREFSIRNVSDKTVRRVEKTLGKVETEEANKISRSSSALLDWINFNLKEKEEIDRINKNEN